MTEQRTRTRKFQWAWVAKTIVVYIIYSVVPLLVANGEYLHPHFDYSAHLLETIWIFSSIVFVSSVAAYISDGVTLWEPVVGTALLTIVGVVYFVARVLFSAAGQTLEMYDVFQQTLVIVAITVVFSLTGSWFGGLAKKLWRRTPPPLV